MEMQNSYSDLLANVNYFPGVASLRAPFAPREAMVRSDTVHLCETTVTRSTFLSSISRTGLDSIGILLTERARTRRTWLLGGSDEPWRWKERTGENRIYNTEQCHVGECYATHLPHFRSCVKGKPTQPHQSTIILSVCKPSPYAILSKMICLQKRMVNSIASSSST